MSEQLPQPWEIWHARFDYSEGRGYKFRPVIVLATHADNMLVAMVTSAQNKLSLEHDYPLLKWQVAGLDKPSIARLDRIAEIPVGYLGTAKLIGHLSSDDIAAIKAILKESLEDSESEENTS